MAEYFAGGHLRFVNGEWRDDNGNAIEISRVRHGKWIHTDLAAHWYGKDECNECKYHEHDRRDLCNLKYCPNCGAKMDGGNGNSDMARTRTLVNRLDIRYNAGSACNTVE